ncbi:MAG: hypothetical protein AVDCRST_MAG02-3873, partial [uncultured Rubrobacteraceae bacterium]
ERSAIRTLPRPVRSAARRGGRGVGALAQGPRRGGEPRLEAHKRDQGAGSRRAAGDVGHLGVLPRL